MSKRIRQKIVEEVRLAEASDPGVLLGDRVREAGLDPSIFCAVIPGDVGTAGTVNRNGRVYPVERGIAQHEKLCLEASSTAIPGHLGHQASQENFNIVVKFLGGAHRITENGAAVMTGKFALLDNDLGRRALSIFRAGFPVGVSKVAWGYPEKHVLDESSPYTRMNPGRKGETVHLIEEEELELYDLVRVASADSYLNAPNEVREAAQQLREAVGEHEEEKPMKTFQEFAEKNADLAKQLREEVQAQIKAEFDGKVKAAEDKTAGLETKLAEAVQATKDADVKAAGAAEREAENDKRIKALEAKNARNELRLQVESKLADFTKGRRAGDLIRTQVMEDFEGGRFGTVEEATKEAERKAALAEGAASAVALPEAGGKPKVTESVDSGAGAAGGSGGKSKMDEMLN